MASDSPAEQVQLEYLRVDLSVTAYGLTVRSVVADSGRRTSRLPARRATRMPDRRVNHGTQRTTTVTAIRPLSCRAALYQHERIPRIFLIRMRSQVQTTSRARICQSGRRLPVGLLTLHGYYEVVVGGAVVGGAVVGGAVVGGAVVGGAVVGGAVVGGAVVGGDVVGGDVVGGDVVGGAVVGGAVVGGDVVGGAGTPGTPTGPAGGVVSVRLMGLMD
jgi:hypothetical protein